MCLSCFDGFCNSIFFVLDFDLYLEIIELIFDVSSCFSRSAYKFDSAHSTYRIYVILM